METRLRLKFLRVRASVVLTVRRAVHTIKVREKDAVANLTANIADEQRRAVITYQANVHVGAAAYLLSAHVNPHVARTLALDALAQGAAEIARLGGVYHYQSERLAKVRRE